MGSIQQYQILKLIMQYAKVPLNINILGLFKCYVTHEYQCLILNAPSNTRTTLLKIYDPKVIKINVWHEIRTFKKYKLSTEKTISYAVTRACVSGIANL
jgi:hypothetical protein